LGVSQLGEFKNTIKEKSKKSMSKTFPEKILRNRQKFRCQFFLDFFVLLRLKVLLSDGSSKTLQKTVYKKNRVEKFLQKNRKKIQNRFFSQFFSHVFGRFSVRGVQKHDKKSHKKI
jgi:hypothetical protein